MWDLHIIVLAIVVVSLTAAAASKPDDILNDLRTKDLSIDETLSSIKNHLTEAEENNEESKKLISNFEKLVDIPESIDEEHCSLNYLKELIDLENMDHSFENTIGQFVVHYRVELFQMCQDQLDDQLNLAIGKLSPEIKKDMNDYEKEKEAAEENKRRKLGKQELEGHILGYIERKHEQDGNSHLLTKKLKNFCTEILQKLDSFIAAVDEELEPLANDKLGDWLHTARECNNLLKPEEME